MIGLIYLESKEKGRGARLHPIASCSYLKKISIFVYKIWLGINYVGLTHRHFQFNMLWRQKSLQLLLPSPLFFYGEHGKAPRDTREASLDSDWGYQTFIVLSQRGRLNALEVCEDQGRRFLRVFLSCVPPSSERPNFNLYYLGFMNQYFRV